jgi:hypothetical protein
MGRAFRIVKRTTHLTVEVTERPQVIKAVGSEGAPASAKASARSASAKAAARQAGKKTTEKAKE